MESSVGLVTTHLEYEKYSKWAAKNNTFLAGSDLFSEYWCRIFVDKKYVDRIISYKPFEIVVTDTNLRELHLAIISSMSGIPLDNIEYEPSSIKGSFVATFEVGEDCPLYVNEYEFKKYKKALENLDEAIYVTSNYNAFLIDNEKLIKHNHVNVWYTKDSDTKEQVLKQLAEYSDMFTVIKPTNENLFDEFCKSFNFVKSHHQPKDETYVTLLNNDCLNGNWFINTEHYKRMITGYKFPLTLPIIRLEINHPQTNHHLVYGSFMFAYITTLQNTPLALSELYKNVTVIYDHNINMYIISFYADSYETIFKIKSILLNPSSYFAATFTDYTEVLNCRLNLSMNGIRSLLSPNKLTVISDKPILMDIEHFTLVKEEINTIINNNNLFMGYISNNNLLGVVNKNNLITSVKPLFGQILLLDYDVNNYEAVYVLANEDVTGDEISLNINSRDYALVLQEKFQEAWDRGLFLSLWARAWTFRTGTPSAASDLYRFEALDDKDQKEFITKIFEFIIKDNIFENFTS